MAKEAVKSVRGKIIGWIEDKPNGDVVVTSFGGKILGRYDSKYNVTRDAHGIILYKGNRAALLLASQQ